MIKNIKACLLLTSLFMLSAFRSQAQMSISGTTCPTAGQTYTYSVSSSYTSGQPTQWQVNGGLIAGTSSNSQNGTGLSSISVVWNTGVSSGTVFCHVYSSTPQDASLTVSASSPLVPGNITSNVGQSVYKTTPATIGCSAASAGGCAPISYSYQWQQSTNQADWTNVPGATGQDLSFSSAPAQTTSYRRYVSTNSGNNGYSGVATVNILPPLSGGSANPSTQTIFSGSTPATIVVSPASVGGGNCNNNYGYQWTSSSNGTDFYPVSGATGTSYTPPVLTQTMYYQLRVTCNSESATSNSTVVNVVPHLVSGTISSSGITINYGTAPAAISSTTATGGMCNSSYSYQWQQSTDGNNTFTDISGATGTNYTPGTLTATTGYRLRTICNSETVYTGVYTVTVYPLLVPGTVSSSAGTINYNSAVTLTSTAATGGSRTYTYQWQSSTGGAAYTNITGATTQNYGPVNLVATTSYQLVVNSNGLPKTSNSVTVTVYPQLLAGAVTPASQTLNYNVPSSTLSGVAATGGNGTYTYQWQSAAASGGPYTPISGATGLGYAPGTLAASSYYQLVVTSNGATATSNTAAVTMYPQFTAGTISPVSQTINYNTAAAAITSTAATGGSSSYTYQWQSSPNGTTWTNIPSATALSYSPGILTSTIYYRLVSTSNGVNATSSTAMVTVYPQLIAGTISPSSQSIAYGTTPASLIATAATGGNNVYAYQWQQSADNVSWANIPGATSDSYSPGALTANTYYRRSVTSNGLILSSVAAGVTVTGASLVMGTNPSQAMNYIVTSTLRTGISAISGPAQLAAMKIGDVNQTVQYFDGLGRPLQTVEVKGSPARNDVIQPVAYDQFGREAQKYLPYVTTGSNDGSYKTNALSGGQSQFYAAPPAGVTAVSGPFAVTNFEPSPLNRVLEQGAPGTDWQPAAGHTQKIVYTTNNEIPLSNTSGTMLAMLYTATINANGSRTLVLGNNQVNFYKSGQLYVTVSKDENWVSGRSGTTEEYKDKEGHVVLKRTFNGAENALQILSTYYVYDNLGNLAYVLPPGTNPDAASIPPYAGSLGYTYRYDERNRLTQKKIPGKGWEFTVYNKLDQPVLTQDSLQRQANQWTVTKYDGVGRVILTGLWNAGSAKILKTLQDSIYGKKQWDKRDSTNTLANYPTGYILSSYPTLSKALTINYYDDYNIPKLPIGYKVTNGVSMMTQGLLTASTTAVLNTITNPTPDMLLDVNYYDDKGRNIRSYKQHYLGAVADTANFDVVLNTYNFNDQVTNINRRHFTRATMGTPRLTIINDYSYDHMGRKLTTREQLQNGLLSGLQPADMRPILSKIEYNELGQVWKKNLHSTDSVTFKQTITYSYNERGWLSISNAPMFAEALYYNENSSNKQYNGNIAYQLWGTSAGLNNNYTYGYDQLNRLITANSTTGNNENGITYDPMGNITALKRYAANAQIDQLTYNYTAGTNTLQSVTDANPSNAGLKSGTANYTYDGNGNLTADNSKGITGISYNLLNLPQAITGKSTTYTYDATGQKLSRLIGTNKTDYISGIQYDGTAASSTISFIQTEEGRALPKDATTYNYEYSLTDHLGNSRVNFDTGTGTARQVQVDDYYAFGMEISTSVASPKNEYLYNKKELQENLGLYDYGARFYDPVIARWTSVDPLVEEDQESTTPYGYVFDNPVKLTDPDGREPCCELELQILGGGAAAAETVEVGSLGTGTLLAGGILLSAGAGAGLAYLSEHLPHLSGSFPSSSGDHPVMSRDNTRVNSYLPRTAPTIINNNTSKKGDTTERGTAGKLEKSPTGKGTVPPSERAKQRVPSAKEKAKEREDNDNKCANCGNETKAKDTRPHHYPDRHADGGKKTVPVCKECHTYLHSKN